MYEYATCKRTEMPVLALIAWSITAIAGLYLLAIWLIEYDPDFQDAAATRLPVPVVCGHVLFAVGGLGSWVMYLVTEKRIYCWIGAGAMALIVTLGFIMAIRWVGVYRARPRHAVGQAVRAPNAAVAVPPERHFPVTGVVAHGFFAVITVVLVALTVLGAGRSLL